MASKDYELDGIGLVRITRRSGSRSLRISLTADGQVRVTIPAWTPYRAGIEFARSKASWIIDHRPAAPELLRDGAQIGKAHHLRFRAGTQARPAARLSGGDIIITVPAAMTAAHPDVQAAARRAAIRALSSQAEALLPKRLRTLAAEYGFSFHSVSVKQLKGRWGSCDNKQNIVCNLYLMQLPWQLIDYVIVHELVHTKHLNHSAAFWSEFERHVPRAKYLRRVMQRYQPILQPAVVSPKPRPMA